MGKGCGGVGASQERGKQCVSARSALLILWEWGQRVRRGCRTKFAKELGITLRDWTWRNGGICEDPKFAYLLLSLEWLVCSQGMIAGD